MKKNKQQNSVYTSKKVRMLRRDWVRNVLIVIMSVILFFSSMYGFRCFMTKVCSSVAVDKFVRDDLTILMPKGALQVEVANTNASRELGLSGRKEMCDDEGLLFVFDVPGKYGFWMKDMNFPIDIIWINQNGIVVNIERDVSPESYKEKKTFINQSEASYVLEINAGMAEKFGLYLGSKVKMSD